jgi:hypothetical protein
VIFKEQLKKLNLKAIPFRYIKDGQTFNVECDVEDGDAELMDYRRKLVGDTIEWADGFYSPLLSNPKQMRKENMTVYVPVWFVTEKINNG